MKTIKQRADEYVSRHPEARIAQLVISPCIRAKWEEVESLNTTGRNGGFGSTGK